MLLSDARFTQATENYLLAWQNLRPAPKVVIDFGGGRKLVRTLKGSTVIYLCRPDGTVVDAFPGVYTPEDFLPLWRQAEGALAQTPLQVLRGHREAATSERLQVATTELSNGKGIVEGPVLAAMRGRPLTASKAVIQGPLLNALGTAQKRPAAEFTDLSALPVTRPEVVARLGLPAAASGMEIVRADSARYLQTRTATRQILGSFQGLPSPEQCLRPLFKQILQVDIDDPYLGLKDEDMPGTP